MSTGWSEGSSTPSLMLATPALTTGSSTTAGTPNGNLLDEMFGEDERSLSGSGTPMDMTPGMTPGSTPRLSPGKSPIAPPYPPLPQQPIMQDRFVGFVKQPPTGPRALSGQGPILVDRVANVRLSSDTREEDAQ